MSDLTHYRTQVTDLGKKAVAAENEKRWEEAYNNYYAALKIFMHMIKYEKNEGLKGVYKEKMQ